MAKQLPGGVYKVKGHRNQYCLYLGERTLTKMDHWHTKLNTRHGYLYFRFTMNKNKYPALTFENYFHCLKYNQIPSEDAFLLTNKEKDFDGLCGIFEYMINGLDCLDKTEYAYFDANLQKIKFIQIS